ncbi:leucyl/phenylalanyl-tRNA--protein transferase [Sphingorhabdus arenilitoris]|uniref:Leucyl/phenylalanyl-tRNA--protein transferase n=1 Tax=Sphingorhabdus arenilitoris TaxID=1490041 RepID=A0ABV8RGF5_9SPHN
MTIDLNLLLRAYAAGYFPMSDARDDPDIYWVEPKKRAIFPLDGIHISKSLAKVIRQDRFRVTTDTAFTEVIALCAEEAEDRTGTWINAQIEQAFISLHQLGHAHSVECWRDGDDGARLVGGLYGLSLGGAFFGESMFSRATDASKVALIWLAARLRMGGYSLLDCQFMTDHLRTLGAVEMDQAEYLKKLAAALAPPLAPGNGLVINGSEKNRPESNDDGQVSVVASSSAGGSASSSPAAPCWSALDGFLGAALLGSSDLGATVSSSPGKLILHSFIQTS